MHDCVERTNIATTVKQVTSNFRPHQNDDSTQQEMKHMSTTNRTPMELTKFARTGRAYAICVYAACMCLVAIVSASLWHAVGTMQVVA
jgi:hypothetical protein